MSVQSLRPFPADDVEHAVNGVDAAAWRRLQGRRVFITGGTGFVGKWLVASLLAARVRFDLDCDIVILSRDPDAFVRQAPHLAQAPGVRLLQGDVVDFEFPDERFDVVIHAATDVAVAGTPLQTFDTCLAGTRRVLDLAARSGAADVLLVSSGAVYGRQPPDLAAMPEHFSGAPDTMAPRTGYGQGKRVAEWLASALAAERGQRLVVARLFAFLGPGMPLDGHFAIANFMRDAMAGAPIVVQGDGTPCRSYLHAADMSAWLWKILFEGRAGEAYNVGSPEAVSIAALARRVKAVLDSPSSVDIRAVAVPGADAERYVPDVTKARDELGLEVSISLDDAIRRTANWHRHPEPASLS